MQSHFKQYLAQQVLFIGSKLAGLSIFAQRIFLKSFKKSNK
jgi:hypothetical protein